ncbi:hypothetical protein mRhiFer1_010054 [Rhinolophus ferrumequinum]|uniref:Uncharacterized protein n=1 Tax=Rhinolophus ferrumequinum TaxID=59479 RepID=A0A7J7Y579_RHIFE|nr:hypothetical protein mRhiFer1_010054 [Rhinolophus ferrumequinum]
MLEAATSTPAHRLLLEKYFLNLTSYQQVMFLDERKQSQPQRSKVTGRAFWPTRPSSLSSGNSGSGNSSDDLGGKKHRQTTEIQTFPHPGEAAFLSGNTNTGSPALTAPSAPGTTPRRTPRERRDRKCKWLGSSQSGIYWRTLRCLFPVPTRNLSDLLVTACEDRRSDGPAKLTTRVGFSGVMLI